MNDAILIIGSAIIANITMFFSKKYKFVAEYPRIVLIAVCIVISTLIGIYRFFIPIEIQSQFIEFISAVSIASSGLYSLLIKPTSELLNQK